MNTNIDHQLNTIAQDMYRLVGTLDKCLICGRACIDTTYSRYLVCSAKCDLRASIEEDEAHDE